MFYDDYLLLLLLLLNVNVAWIYKWMWYSQDLRWNKKFLDSQMTQKKNNNRSS